MAEPPDLFSLVLTLRPLPPAGEQDRPAPRWWGRAAHALLLDTIRQVDAGLAHSLHDESGVRPFSASNLMGHFRRGLPDPAQTYTLRFTALNQRLTGLLLEAARPGGTLAAGTRVELDYFTFEVQPAAWSPDQHPWAASTSYTLLFNTHLLPTNPPPRRVSLHFASPTAFHSEGRTVPLPLPGLVFNSLVERWNSFAPAALPPEVRRYAAECLNISRFRLRSLAVSVKDGGLRIGAVGEVTYTTSAYDRYWMSLVSALAAFAQFGGVGGGVSYGMGQCRQVQLTDREE